MRSLGQWLVPKRLRTAIVRQVSKSKQIYVRVKRRPWHVAVTSLLVIALGVGVSSAGVFLSSLDLPDKLAAETVILTAAGFLLAMLAAVVAILAYRLSAQKPKLGLSIVLGGLTTYPVVFIIDKHKSSSKLGDTTYRPLSNYGKMPENFVPGEYDDLLTLQIGIRNLGDYTARNPAVKIEFLGFRGLESSENWQITPPVAQWEGGADYAVHGNWTRYLPPLNLVGLEATEPEPNWKGTTLSHHVGDQIMFWDEQYALLVEIVAEGFRQLFAVEAKVVTAKGWVEYWLADTAKRREFEKEH
jgi:hypothetical protein